MTIALNGERVETRAQTVEALVADVLGDRTRDGVAVAIGDEVVRRSTWATRELREGDRVEIIRAVGGG